MAVIDSDITIVLWAAVKAFLIALVLTPIVRDIFRAYNVVDRPGRRKVHSYPIPRVGGIPIAIAYAISLISITNLSEAFPDYNTLAWKLVPGAAAMFFIGLLDDFFTFKPKWKLLGEIAAAIIVFANGLRIDFIANTPLPMWISFPLTLLWLLLTTNALNLIDGLDGLCAGIGLVATLTLFGGALLQGNLPLAYATFPLVGALVGFLCYNFNPATVFLGDSGALLIGFLLGCYGMIWTDKSATILSLLVPLLALTVPLLDVSLSIVRRFIRNKPIFSADRGHIHHRLIDRGLSTRRAVLILYLGAGLAAAFALILSYPSLSSYKGFVLVGLGGMVWLAVQQLRYEEFGAVVRLLFRGGLLQDVRFKLQIARRVLALELASTEDEWWNVLTILGRDLNWSKIQLATSQGGLRERILTDDPTVWSFRVPLGNDTEYLVIEGTAAASNPSLHRAGFAETLRASFSTGRHGWEQLLTR